MPPRPAARQRHVVLAVPVLCCRRWMDPTPLSGVRAPTHARISIHGRPRTPSCTSPRRSTERAAAAPRTTCRRRRGRAWLLALHELLALMLYSTYLHSIAHQLEWLTSSSSSCPGGRPDKLESPRGGHDALTSREQVRSGTSPARSSPARLRLLRFAWFGFGFAGSKSRPAIPPPQQLCARVGGRRLAAGAGVPFAHLKRNQLSGVCHVAISSARIKYWLRTA